MITNVFNAVKGFFQYIRNFGDALWNLLKKAFALLPVGINYINLVLHALPVWLWVLLTILLSVCILYKVLGKET